MNAITFFMVAATILIVSSEIAMRLIKRSRNKKEQKEAGVVSLINNITKLSKKRKK